MNEEVLRQRFGRRFRFYLSVEDMELLLEWLDAATGELHARPQDTKMHDRLQAAKFLLEEHGDEG